MPFESTHLHYYLDLIRDESYHDSGYSLFNILNTWKSARNNKIINEDFSHIDFGYIPLNNIDFSDGEHPSSFREATLSDENYVSGHVGKILCSAISPNNKYILTGGEDKTAILWETNTGFVHAKIEMQSEVEFVNFSDDSSECFIGAHRQLPVVWDIEQASIVFDFMKLVEGTAFFKKDLIKKKFGYYSNIIYSDNKRYCIISRCDSFIVFDINARTYTELYAKENIGEVIAFSNNCKQVITKKVNIKSGSVIKIIDASNGKEIFCSPIYSYRNISAVFFPDNQYIVIFTTSSETTDCNIIGVFNYIHNTEFLQPSKSRKLFSKFVFSSDGSLGAVSSKCISIVELKSKKKIAEFNTNYYESKFNLAVFSPDNRFLIASIRPSGKIDDCIYVYDIFMKKFINQLTGHSGCITSLSFSNNSRFLISTDSNGRCIVWDISTWKNILSLSGHQMINECSAFLSIDESPNYFNSKMYNHVAVSINGRSITFWDADDKKAIGFDAIIGKNSVMRLTIGSPFPSNSYSSHDDACIKSFSFLHNKEIFHLFVKPIQDNCSKIQRIWVNFSNNTRYQNNNISSIAYVFDIKEKNLRQNHIINPFDERTHDNSFFEILHSVYELDENCIPWFSPHNSFFYYHSKKTGHIIYNETKHIFKKIDVDFFVASSAFSFDESFLLLGGYDSGSALLFDTNGNKLYELSVDDRCQIISVGFSRNSKYCFIQSSLLVGIYKVDDGEMVKTYINKSWIMISISKAKIVSDEECIIWFSDGRVILWNFITENKKRISFHAKEKKIFEAATYSDDIKYAATTLKDRIRLIDVSRRTYTDLYNVDGVNVLNCDFTDVKASDKLKAILYQNNAGIEPPPETPI